MILDEANADILPLFLEEFDERLHKIEQALLASEDSAGISFQNVKRELHTLKGNASSMGFAGCAQLCHRLEDFIAGGDESSILVDRLLDGVTVLREAMESMSLGHDLALAVAAANNAGSAQPKPASARADASAKTSSQADQPPPMPFSVLYATSGAPRIAQIFADNPHCDVHHVKFNDVLNMNERRLSKNAVCGNALVIDVTADHFEQVSALIERLRYTESSRGIYGESRLDIVMILHGAQEETCRQMRAVGGQHVFGDAADPRIPLLLSQLAAASRRGPSRRRNQRFRELMEVFVVTPDKGRQRAAVLNESYSGIAILVLDPAALSFGTQVALDVLGAPMPAWVVRVCGRDQRGRYLVGLRWGYFEEGISQDS